MRIEWHPEAFEELRRLGTSDQRRIKKVLDALNTLDDPRKKLVPYSGNLKGFWKLRVGDYRLVCELVETDGEMVLVISVAHRSVAYDRAVFSGYKTAAISPATPRPWSSPHWR